MFRPKERRPGVEGWTKKSFFCVVSLVVAIAWQSRSPLQRRTRRLNNQYDDGERACTSFEELVAALASRRVNTIVLTRDLNVTETIEINRTVSIRSNGERQIVLLGGQQQSRIFLLNSSSAHVRLEGLALERGLSSAVGGGAALVARGTLEMVDCAVRANSVEGAMVVGGGVMVGAEGNASIRDSQVERNTAADLGGGIALFGGELTLSDCNLTRNFGGGGSATYVDGGTLRVVRSVFEANNASVGTVWVHAGDATFEECLFRTNTNAIFGGGVYAGGGIVTLENTAFISNIGGGGGVYVANAALYVTGCTFENNAALDNDDYGMKGGAIFARESTVTASESKFRGNRATSGSNVHVRSGSFFARSLVSDDGEWVVGSRTSRFVVCDWDPPVLVDPEDVLVEDCEVWRRRPTTPTTAPPTAAVVPSPLALWEVRVNVSGASADDFAATLRQPYLDAIAQLLDVSSSQVSFVQAVVRSETETEVVYRVQVASGHDVVDQVLKNAVEKTGEFDEAVRRNADNLEIAATVRAIAINAVVVLESPSSKNSSSSSSSSSSHHHHHHHHHKGVYAAALLGSTVLAGVGFALLWCRFRARKKNGRDPEAEARTNQPAAHSIPELFPSRIRRTASQCGLIRSLSRSSSIDSVAANPVVVAEENAEEIKGDVELVDQSPPKTPKSRDRVTPKSPPRDRAPTTQSSTDAARTPPKTPPRGDGFVDDDTDGETLTATGCHPLDVNNPETSDGTPDVAGNHNRESEVASDGASFALDIPDVTALTESSESGSTTTTTDEHEGEHPRTPSRGIRTPLTPRRLATTSDQGLINQEGSLPPSNNDAARSDLDHPEDAKPPTTPKSPFGRLTPKTPRRRLVKTESARGLIDDPDSTQNLEEEEEAEEEDARRTAAFV